MKEKTKEQERSDGEKEGEEGKQGRKKEGGRKRREGGRGGGGGVDEPSDRRCIQIRLERVGKTTLSVMVSLST